MTTVNPVPRESAVEELKDIYHNLTEKHGRIPNFYGVMAHHPAVLQQFPPFYSAIMSKGSIEPRYKELAYLETSIVNGCEY